jgi:hypothetical protein
MFCVHESDGLVWQEILSLQCQYDPNRLLFVKHKGANFCLDPSNILDKFFLGGIRVQYLSCIFTHFAMLLQLSEFTGQE